MMRSSLILAIAVVFISCSKSSNTNPIIGKWYQTRLIDQYVNPYTSAIQFDTLGGTSLEIEFKRNGDCFANGYESGTYSMNDSTFVLKPFNYNYTILDVGSSKLKLRTSGNGKQKKIFDSSNSGEFRVAQIKYEFSEYQREN